MGPDASHSTKAATAGVRHQTTVVWPVLVSFIMIKPVNAQLLEADMWRYVCVCRDVHAVCLWDDKGPAKIHQALKEDILDFIKQAQAVRPVYMFVLYVWNYVLS